MTHPNLEKMLEGVEGEWPHKSITDSAYVKRLENALEVSIVALSRDNNDPMLGSSNMTAFAEIRALLRGEK